METVHRRRLIALNQRFSAHISINMGISQSDIIITKVNESLARVDCDRTIMYRIADWFKFRAPNYMHHPQYKNKMWDGFIRLLNKRDQTLPVGLVPRLITQINSDTDYSFDIDESFLPPDPIDSTFFDKFLSKLILTDERNATLVPDDNQRKAVMHLINEMRATIISPTSSGKSLIIYLITRYLLGLQKAKKVLVIVPTIMLTNQMRGDFNDYGQSDPTWKQSSVHVIHKGKEKDNSKQITISTWQSLQKLPPKWFEAFDAVVVDEAHTAKAAVITKIMNACINARYRLGTTGTTDGEEANELTLEGLFGPKVQFITTKEMIDAGRATDVRVECINLDYSLADKKFYNNLADQGKMSYPDEIKYLVNHNMRNQFLANLARTRKGNTLLLVSRVEEHAIPLHKLISEMCGDDKVVVRIDKDIPADVREAHRKMAETQDNIIFIATYQIFSTGVNIKNLHHIILASPSKSKIRILQSIGRILRKHHSKLIAIVYDISDKLTERKKKNFSYQHFVERLKIYIHQQFKYRISKIDLP